MTLALMSDKTFHTYVDWTMEETPRPFYVGKGNENRINCLKRNIHHTRVSNKHGIDRRIVLITTDEQLAFNEEIKLIAEHHTFIDDHFYNGIGCNYTIGGEGHTPSNEMRKAYSDRMIVFWNNPEFKARACEKMKGHNRPHSQEWKYQHSERMSGTGNPNFGKKFSKETCAKLSAWQKGKQKASRGKKMKPDAMAANYKQITVIDSIEGRRTFVSRKEAAQVIANELGLSSNTIKCWFVARKISCHGLTFEYTDVENK